MRIELIADELVKLHITDNIADTKETITITADRECVLTVRTIADKPGITETHSLKLERI